MGKFIDLTGQKFGRLTVLKRVDDYITPKGQHATQWLCVCDCDERNLVTVTSGRLKSGNTKSCGCLVKDLIRQKNKLCKKYNAYDLSGEYGVGYTLKNEEFYFDLEDYDLIKDYCWRKDKDGYLVARDTNNGGKVVRMHRLIMGMPDISFDIDHINGWSSICDNRKSNLRLVTKSQNAMNRSIFSNNTSGAKGVSWNKEQNKWVAYIAINNKQINLGMFDNFDDAVKARKEAEEEYFGEFSYDNSRKAV